MNSKYILIIVAAVAVIAVAAGYFMFSNQLEYEHTTLVLSKSAYMESPVAENISGKPDKNGVYYYVDEENGVNITSCSNISIANSSDTMKKLRDEVQSESKKTYENGVAVYEKNGIYSVFVKNIEYNDTILIQSLSKDLLLACQATLKFHDPSDSLKFDNTTGGTVVNAVEQTEEAVQSTIASTQTESSSSSSYSTSDYTSASDWGYGVSFSSSGSSSSSYSESSGSSGGYATVDDFDFT